MPINFAVIPVAGQGTRLLPLTKSQPKEMLPVGRKPIVQHVVEELTHSGISKICLVTGPGKQSIENHFDGDEELIQMLRKNGREELLETLDFERKAIEYFYTRQRRQLGLGHAILSARSLVNDQSFVVALGDSIIGLHVKSRIVAQLVEQFEKKEADAAIAFEEVPPQDVVKYGIAEPRDDKMAVFELEGIVEKPSQEEATSNLAIAARYVFSPIIFDFLAETKPGINGEIQLTDAIQALIQKGGKVIGLKLNEGEERFDIGNPLSYFRAFVDFALADPEYGEALSKWAKSRFDNS